MLGLTLRVTAVMVGAMLLVVMITGGAFFLQRRADSENGARLPLPDRIAAIVQLLEGGRAPDEAALLRAVNSEDVQVSLDTAGWPQQAQDQPDFPGLVYLTRRYLSVLGDRRVDASVGDESHSRRRLMALLGPDSLRTGTPLRLRVELRDGRVAVIDVPSSMLRRPLGRQLVLGAGLLILLTAVLSAWSLKRQIGPLETLADAVDRFGSQMDVAPLRRRSKVREVQRLVGAFERMRGRIRGLLEGRTRMLAAISHDLGTYLTRLRLRIDYIADADQRERAERDLGDMQQLLRDTLALARLDSAAEANERVDLRALAEREVAAFTEAGAPVFLQFADGDEPLLVAGRGLSLARVFSNLIGNALKYGGGAEVSLETDGGCAVIRVEDRGPGIPPAERELVLEPFYRRDHARTLDAPGSGLGLAIVADIVGRHGGAVQLEDRPGGGLSVRVRLPRIV